MLESVSLNAEHELAENVGHTRIELGVTSEATDPFRDSLNPALTHDRQLRDCNAGRWLQQHMILLVRRHLHTIGSGSVSTPVVAGHFLQVPALVIAVDRTAVQKSLKH